MCQFIGSDFGCVAPKPFFGNATPTYHYQTNKRFCCSLVVHIQRFLLVVLNFVWQNLHYSMRMQQELEYKILSIIIMIEEYHCEELCGLNARL